MPDTSEWEAKRVRDFATRLADPDLPALERDRVQRMLLQACKRLADKTGLDAPGLYWAALGHVPPEETTS